MLRFFMVILTHLLGFVMYEMVMTISEMRDTILIIKQYLIYGILNDKLFCGMKLGTFPATIT